MLLGLGDEFKLELITPRFCILCVCFVTIVRFQRTIFIQPKINNFVSMRSFKCFGDVCICFNEILTDSPKRIRLETLIHRIDVWGCGKWVLHPISVVFALSANGGRSNPNCDCKNAAGKYTMS